MKQFATLAERNKAIVQDVLDGWYFEEVAIMHGLSRKYLSYYIFWTHMRKHYPTVARAARDRIDLTGDTRAGVNYLREMAARGFDFIGEQSTQRWIWRRRWVKAPKEPDGQSDAEWVAWRLSRMGRVIRPTNATEVSSSSCPP